MMHERDIEKEEKDEAKERAIERASRKCPVIIKANKALDEIEDGKHVDVEYCLDILIASLNRDPVASATVDLMNKIKTLTNKIG